MRITNCSSQIKPEVFTKQEVITKTNCHVTDNFDIYKMSVHNEMQRLLFNTNFCKKALTFYWTICKNTEELSTHSCKRVKNSSKLKYKTKRRYSLSLYNLPTVEYCTLHFMQTDNIKVYCTQSIVCLHLIELSVLFVFLQLIF